MQERRTGRGGRGDTKVRRQVTERQASATQTLKERESPDETKGTLRSTNEGAKMKVASSASLPEKRDPVTEVNKTRGKETKGSLKVRETRGTPNDRDNKEKKGTEYYSNGTKKAETSQGLDDWRGKKSQEGSMEVAGSPALQGHHQNLRHKVTGAGEHGQQGVPKPLAAKNKAVPKATVETEQGSQPEVIHTKPVGGEPDPNPETKQEPPVGKILKSRKVQEREPPVRGDQYPTFWGRRIPTSPSEATKETIKQEQRAQGGPDQDKGQGGKRIPDDNRKKPRDPKDIP